MLLHVTVFGNYLIFKVIWRIIKVNLKQQIINSFYLKTNHFKIPFRILGLKNVMIVIE
jgi:hypothetical protein